MNASVWLGSCACRLSSPSLSSKSDPQELIRAESRLPVQARCSESNPISCCGATWAMRRRGREWPISIGLIPYCCSFLYHRGKLREEPALLLWGQHPIAPMRISGPFSNHETGTLLPKPTLSRHARAGTDAALVPHARNRAAVPRRTGAEGIPYLFERRLSSRT
jgi:hypothetical protein